MKFGSLAAAAVLLGLGIGLAQAQTQTPATPPMRIRGTIVALDGNLMTVTSREGQALKITLADPVTVTAPKKLALADIAANSYIGTAALPQADGTLVAQEVVVFPESARGNGEGQFPWDLTAGSMMTNANVAAMVESKDGRELSLAYKGGTAKVRVPAGVPIVTFVPAAKTDLKSGAKVFLSATKGADGGLTAARVTVEKDGVAPPM